MMFRMMKNRKNKKIKHFKNVLTFLLKNHFYEEKRQVPQISETYMQSDVDLKYMKNGECVDTDASFFVRQGVAGAALSGAEVPARCDGTRGPGVAVTAPVLAL